MSVSHEREEERKSSSTTRNVGLAAAAVGVGLGVGAALYYFFNKPESENPHGEGPSSQHNFRQRSWSLEECSVCCEVMVQSSEAPLLMLPCGHKFHERCVQPWTQEHSTCPNCRKAV